MFAVSFAMLAFLPRRRVGAGGSSCHDRVTARRRTAGSACERGCTERAGIRAEVPPGALVHALRHTFATTALEGGASVVEVQQLQL